MNETLDDFNIYVGLWKLPSEHAALLVFEEIEQANLGEGAGARSLWRLATPDKSEWLVAAVATSRELVDEAGEHASTLGGEPVTVPPTTAEGLVSRFLDAMAGFADHSVGRSRLSLGGRWALTASGKLMNLDRPQG